MKANYGFHATMAARPGKGDELVATLLIPTTGKDLDRHCLVYLVGRSVTNPDIVYVTEGWTTKEAHALNFASVSSQVLLHKVAPLLNEAPHYHDIVPVGGAFRGMN